METNQDFITYKSVNIFNVRNASTNSIKVMTRNIAVTYTADRWCEGGNAFRGTASVKKAQAMIDWLLANGATVVDGRIVTTMGDFDICEFGDITTGVIGYSEFMKKAGK
jgi:hypothetical protein